ncbi:MAG TPA: hypothetical protein VGI78_21040 [Acetobacteraceae bacterium]
MPDPGPTTAHGSITVGHGQQQNLASYLQSLVTQGVPGDQETIVSVKAQSGTVTETSFVFNGSASAQTIVEYTAPASGSDTLTYTVADQLGDTASGTVAITVDPGPTTTAATATLQLGQSLDLTKSILAADKSGLAGDQLSIVSGNTNGTLGNVSLVNGDLVYSATGPTLANMAANGAAADSFTYVVSDQFGDSAVGTVNLTVTNPVTVINGGPYGGSTIQGVSGAEQINAFGYTNTINANGGSGTVNAGQGQATVNAGSGNLTINLAGYGNVVSGGNGADTVTGSQGTTAVTLGDGADVVQLAGYNNTIALGNGNDSISAGAGNAIVSVGNGNDTITAAGYGNQITVGNGNDSITAGDGSARIVGGSGTDTVQLQGYSNTVSFTGGNDTITGGQGSDVFDLTGGNASLALHGSNEMVFLNGANATINDQGSGLAVKIASGGTDVIQNFGSDASGYIDLLGGVGGYTSASQVLAALTSDGHGGTTLALGSSGSIDFANVGVSQLHASNFQFN